MDSSQILAIIKNPGEAPTLGWLPSSRDEVATQWETPVREQLLNDPRLLVLWRESEEFGGDINLTLPAEVRGPVAIVASEPGPRYGSVPREQVYRWIQWAMLAGASTDADSVTYYGITEGPGYDRVYVERVDHARRATRAPLTHHVRHSATGFSWGFAGKGPTELARCLLADFLHLAAPFLEIESIYEAFKQDVIAQLPQDLGGWRIHGYEVLGWLREHPPTPVCNVHEVQRRPEDGVCAECASDRNPMLALNQ
ncbi:hypothetical protein EPN42_01540 [bacterium]|nr:MAG: hypothetical protein EPN42_01540 [bacterium]